MRFEGPPHRGGIVSSRVTTQFHSMDLSPHQSLRGIDVRAYLARDPIPFLTIASEGALRVDYAPVDHVETDARLVIVGLTPGRKQAATAWEVFSREIGCGASREAALRIAKREASFCGAQMRAHLTDMLDLVGVPRVVGVPTAAEFFADLGLVHFTSSLRYPVYNGEENYSGHPLNGRMLRGMVEQFLSEEVDAIRNAVWIPLGAGARYALAHLVALGRLDATRILGDLPHPSGANSERVKYFLGRKSRAALSKKTNADRLERARARLLAQVDVLATLHGA